MAQNDNNNVRHISDYQQSQAKSGGSGLNSGGGGDTFDPMEHRVTALEKGFERVERKIDTLITDVAEMKGQLKGMPTAIQFGELKGRVDSLPTMAKIGTLTAIAVGFVTLVLKWNELWAFLKP